MIHFSLPYIDWQAGETDKEIAVIQITVYVFLVIFSSLSFGSSMRSAFSTRKFYLYY